MKILVVEDDKVTCHMLRRLLESWGHEVDFAENGARAWDMFQADRFPIVISDWMMPELDGIELVRRIRSMSNQGYTYTILLTAKSRKDDVVEGMDAGADDFMIKPFDVSELHSRIRAGERIIALEQNLAQKNNALEKAGLAVAESNQRIRRDLEVAARIQRGLLPRIFPDESHVKFAWAYQPCDELAGDILNVFRLDNRHVAMYVLDVSGHGVASALLSVALHHLLSPVMDQSNLLKRRTDEAPGYVLATPQEVASHLNRQYPLQNEFGLYFTILYGLLNLDTYQFRYMQAGHPKPIHMPSGASPCLVDSRGLPIGFFEDAEFDEFCIQLQPGDRMLLYSDGLFEVCNDQEQQFGQERLMGVMEDSRDMPLQASLDRMTDQARQWSGSLGLRDDISMVGLEILP